MGKSGIGENAFERLGGVEGITALVRRFYQVMEEMPEAARLRQMHPPDIQPVREKLTMFLCGWLGGPPLYASKFGPINLTELHLHLNINTTEKQLWLSCMANALKKHQVDAALAANLIASLEVPAEKIARTCQQQQKSVPGVLPTEPPGTF